MLRRRIYGVGFYPALCDPDIPADRRSPYIIAEMWRETARFESTIVHPRSWWFAPLFQHDLGCFWGLGDLWNM